jgi:hypothetical protein
LNPWVVTLIVVGPIIAVVVLCSEPHLGVGRVLQEEEGGRDRRVKLVDGRKPLVETSKMGDLRSGHSLEEERAKAVHLRS